MHDAEHRQFMVTRSPECARGIVKIPIALYVHHETSATARSQCCTGTGPKAIAHAPCTLTSEKTVGFVVFPELAVMRPDRMFIIGEEKGL